MYVCCWWFIFHRVRKVVSTQAPQPVCEVVLGESHHIERFGNMRVDLVIEPTHQIRGAQCGESFAAMALETGECMTTAVTVAMSGSYPALACVNCHETRQPFPVAFSLAPILLFFSTFFAL
jgi:hypothetical protein